jgi:diacylglycerol kinase (CTP)
VKESEKEKEEFLMAHAISSGHISPQLRVRTDLHILRKIWHITTGVVGLVIFFSRQVSENKMAQVLFIFSVISFLIEILRLKNESINAIVLKVMKPFMRESEKNSLSGMPFYALGVSLSLFFFAPKIAVLSILFLVLADPIASFFGILYGTDKILPNKSLQGSLAAFTVCYLVTLVYGLIHTGSSMNLLVFAIIGGFIGSLSELFSYFVDDNLCIPVLSGLGLSILNYFLPMF